MYITQGKKRASGNIQESNFFSVTVISDLRSKCNNIHNATLAFIDFVKVQTNTSNQ